MKTLISESFSVNEKVVLEGYCFDTQIVTITEVHNDHVVSVTNGVDTWDVLTYRLTKIK
jgi:hypothetical protein